MIYFLGISLIASILGNIFLSIYLTKLHQEEKKELHNRLMSRDYPEFKMAQDYDLELQRKKVKIENDARQKMKSEKITKEEQHRKDMAAKL